MSGLTSFYKQNALKAENEKYVASERFLDSDGKVISWEIKALTGKDDEALRRRCTKRILIPGRKGMTREELDGNLYIGKLAVECTVFPNLKDAALQDSYGVMGDDELLKTMLTPGEYTDYIVKVQEVNGFEKKDIEVLAEEIKN